MGKEQPQDFYDALYTDGGANKSYHKHYAECNYYYAWKAVVEKLAARAPEHILDVGCGPGQFARMVADSLSPLPRYTGIDFSEVAVAMARKNCPGARFVQADLLREPLPADGYDCVVCLEVLEHIGEDIRVLQKLRRGAPILFSVPSFDSTGHVRRFPDEDAVRKRYGRHVAIEDISRMRLANPDEVLFIVAGSLNEHQ